MNKPSTPVRVDPCSDCVTHYKNALPILPVRYAVARSDMGAAPTLPANFREHVASIPLPENTAHYTLRLLRPGYLYMFDEARKEWSGYVVDEYGYLDELDVYAKSPPMVDAVIFSDECKGHNAHCRARCIPVRDAAYATRVWLSFSDVFWTQAVLEKHAKAEYREAHMQCINVAAWREGAWQPQTAGFDALNHVAELVANGRSLRDETYGYVTRYLPQPYRMPQELLKDDAKTKKAASLISPLFTRLLPAAVGSPVNSGPVASAAWAFSPQPFFLAQDELAGLAAWGAQAAKPARAAMVGLADPVGIALELNGLAGQRGIEFSDEPQRKSKYETALAIAAVREAVKNDAVKNELLIKNLETTSGYPFDGMTPVFSPDGIVHQESLSDADQQAAGATVWPKYTDYFKRDEWESYLGERADTSTETNYRAALEDFARTTLAPLDVPYLAWLKSDALHSYFSHNYDSFHLGNGQAYTDLVTTLISDASGRNAVFEYLKNCLTQDPSDPSAWLMRALALNHEPLILAWKEEALKEATTSELSWADLAEQFHDKFKEIIVDGAEGEKKLDSVARYIYQIAGPLIFDLSKALDTGVAVLAQKILHARWQMGILGVVARAGNKNLILVDLRGEWTRKQAARTLTRLLGKLSGTYAAEYRVAARGALDELENVKAERHPFHGIMLVDRAKAETLIGLSGAARRIAKANVMTPASFEEIFKDSVGKLGNMDVKTGAVQMVLSLYTTANSFKEMISAKPEKTTTKVVNFAAGIAGLTGGVVEIGGNVLKEMEWGASPAARQFKFFTLEVVKKADWFIVVGKILGTVGSTVAGVIQIMEGFEMSDNHLLLKYSVIGVGGVSVIVALASIFFSMAAGVGLLIGLVLALVTVVVAWLKPNALQDWLEKSLCFGHGKQLFDGPASQALALEALVKGE